MAFLVEKSFYNHCIKTPSYQNYDFYRYQLSIDKYKESLIDDGFSEVSPNKFVRQSEKGVDEICIFEVADKKDALKHIALKNKLVEDILNSIPETIWLN